VKGDDRWGNGGIKKFSIRGGRESWTKSTDYWWPGLPIVVPVE